MSAWSALPSPGIAIFALPGENLSGLPRARNLLRHKALPPPPPEGTSVREFRILALDVVVADN